MNVLFVCGRNKWRSRTAEDLFKNNAGYNVRSAGTAATARVKVSEKLLLKKKPVNNSLILSTASTAYNPFANLQLKDVAEKK